MATHMPMVSTRQPFAPLNSSRLQNLTNLKNRQNAITSPVKRKAASYEHDQDSENVDPVLFLSPKRSKAQDGTSKDPSAYVKPVNFFLTKAPPSPTAFSAIKSTPVSPARRPILPARSPAPRLNTKLKSTPLSAPAGRSPTRKRIGILNRRKTAGSPFQRIDPPKFATPSSSGLGFSIDAALSGTISSFKSSNPAPARAAAPAPISLKHNANLIPQIHTESSKDSWFFDIHEDTAEELATNLMEHGACTLDISSDEESAQRLADERGKENVPPMDDISQTRTVLSSIAGTVDTVEAEISDVKARIKARRSRREVDEQAIDIDRSPLGDLAAEDFYAEGCDAASIFVIASDDTYEEVPAAEEAGDEHDIPVPTSTTFDFVAEVDGKGPALDIDALMAKDDVEMASKAKLLEPIEKAEEGFSLWESGSAKDENENEL